MNVYSGELISIGIPKAGMVYLRKVDMASHALAFRFYSF